MISVCRLVLSFFTLTSCFSCADAFFTSAVNSPTFESGDKVPQVASSGEVSSAPFGHDIDLVCTPTYKPYSNPAFLDAYVAGENQMMTSVGELFHLGLTWFFSPPRVVPEDASSAKIEGFDSIRILKPGSILLQISDRDWKGRALLASVDSAVAQKIVASNSDEIELPQEIRSDFEYYQGYFTIDSNDGIDKLENLFKINNLRSKLISRNNRNGEINGQEVVIVVIDGGQGGERDPVVTHWFKCDEPTLCIVVPNGPSGPQPASMRIAVSIYMVQVPSIARSDSFQVLSHRLTGTSKLEDRTERVFNLMNSH